MENKYLVKREEGFLKKIFSTIKSFFGFNKKSFLVEEKEIETEKNKKTSDFLSEIKLYVQEDEDSLQLKNKYENNQVSLEDMSREELNTLNSLYIKEKNNKLKKLDNLKTEIAKLKYSLNNM